MRVDMLVEGVLVQADPAAGFAHIGPDRRLNPYIWGFSEGEA